MNWYLKGAYWVSVVGLIQVVSFNIGFSPGYDYSWIFNKWGINGGGVLGIRLNSIFSEPSYFGASIAPAFFIACHSLLFGSKLFIETRQSLVIIIAYLLTFSTVSYAGIAGTVILLLINFGLIRYMVVAIPLIVIGYTYLHNNVPEFRDRVDGVVALYTGKTQSAFDVHGSSFVQYNNFQVAYTNILANPLFGTGLGSHAVAYERYSVAEKFGGIYNFNKTDGNSMLIRLMSETGLYGLLFMFFFIRNNFVLRDRINSNELHWVVSNATLLMILLQLMRQGNYTYNGFMFYMWLYYFNYRNYNNHEEVELKQEQLQTVKANS